MAEPEQAEEGQTVSNLPNLDEPAPQDYANIAGSGKSAFPTAQTQQAQVETEPLISDPVEAAGQDDVTKGPPAPPQSLLDRQNGVDLYLSQSGEPWLLPVDALVLPVGKEGGVYGSMAQAVLSLLDEGSRSQLTSEMQSLTGPDFGTTTPTMLLLSEEAGQTLLPNTGDSAGDSASRRLILATAADASVPQEMRPAAAAVVKLAAANGARRLAVPLLGTGRGPFSDDKVAVGEAMMQGILDGARALPPGALKAITLATRSEAVIKAINFRFNNRAQTLSNDQAAGEDLLFIQREVEALAETLLLNEVRPPIAVGVLGGWGSGKSFVMHLMRQKMSRVRGLRIQKGWPDESGEGRPSVFVGHIYQINFNAWTYVKSNLWASLMQTIFVELNRQLTLEVRLKETFEAVQSNPEVSPAVKAMADLKEGGDIWFVLNEMGRDERQAFLQSELRAEAFKVWQERRTTDSLWEVFRQVRQEEVQRLEKAQAERDKKQKALDDVNCQVAWSKFVQDKLWQELIKLFGSSLQGQLKAEDLADLSEFAAKLQQLRPTLTGWWALIRKRPRVVRFFIGFVLLAIGAYVAGQWLPWLKDMASWGQMMGMAGSVVSAILVAYRAFRDRQQSLQEAYDQAMSLMADQEAMMHADVPVDATPEQRRLISEIAQLDGVIARYQRRIGVNARFTSVYEFVQSRLDSGYYQKQLGLMQQVQEDLQELSDALVVHKNDMHAGAKQKFFPRGQPRVALYIDDLDRCPPKRVVEVLEAVQLLLKTELFVVVLGLDTRYITRALEKAYTGILTPHGDPSGLDYIEKIIQIPYRVRPIEPQGMENFLRAEMDVPLEFEIGQEQIGDAMAAGLSQGAGSGGGLQTLPQQPLALRDLQPEAVQFDADDLADFNNCCSRLSLTPRNVKRLVNVVKLMKIFWFRAYEDKPRPVVRAVINLLALSARHPELMREAFQQLETACREEASAQALQFGQFLTGFNPSQRTRIYYADSLTLFQADVEALKPQFGAVTLADLTASTFNLVRSFSFVGDPQYDNEG